MLLNIDKSCLVLVDVQDKLTPLVQEPNALVQKIEWLLKLATQLNVPMVMNMQYPKGLGQTIDTLKPYAYQAIIEKTVFSCAKAPHFIETLSKLERKQIILMGIETHVCVLQTAVDLLQSGYEVFVVIDAVSARKKMDHKYALKRMKQLGCQLVTSEMVFFEWVCDAAHPKFKALSQAFLQEQQ